MIEGYLGKPEAGVQPLQRAVAILEKHADTEPDNLNSALNGLLVAQVAAGDSTSALDITTRLLAEACAALQTTQAQVAKAVIAGPHRPG